MNKEQLYQIIFKADTPKGKRFDVILLWVILASVAAVFLESVPEIKDRFSNELFIIEWGFTLFFSIEYITRIYCAPNRVKYIFSFFGLVDLLSIIPTFVGLIIAGSQSLLVIRSLRLLRVFRVLKLVAFLKESNVIINALKASRYKITVFLVGILTINTILGTLMYLIESPEAGFTSIPRSIYWSIVTLTTVGYGDITPQTVAGQTLAGAIMILGYAIIAVPTGIITKELISANGNGSRSCPRCSESVPRENNYCGKCGEKVVSNSSLSGNSQ